MRVSHHDVNDRKEKKPMVSMVQYQDLRYSEILFLDRDHLSRIKVQLRDWDEKG